MWHLLCFRLLSLLEPDKPFKGLVIRENPKAQDLGEGHPPMKVTDSSLAISIISPKYVFGIWVSSLWSGRQESLTLNAPSPVNYNVVLDEALQFAQLWSKGVVINDVLHSFQCGLLNERGKY